jgi:hypothetical protein
MRTAAPRHLRFAWPMLLGFVAIILAVADSRARQDDGTQPLPDVRLEMADLVPIGRAEGLLAQGRADEAIELLVPQLLIPSPGLVQVEPTAPFAADRSVRLADEGFRRFVSVDRHVARRLASFAVADPAQRERIRAAVDRALPSADPQRTIRSTGDATMLIPEIVLPFASRGAERVLAEGDRLLEGGELRGALRRYLQAAQLGDDVIANSDLERRLRIVRRLSEENAARASSAEPRFGSPLADWRHVGSIRLTEAIEAAGLDRRVALRRDAAAGRRDDPTLGPAIDDGGIAVWNGRSLRVFDPRSGAPRFPLGAPYDDDPALRGLVWSDLPDTLRSVDRAVEGHAIHRTIATDDLWSFTTGRAPSFGGAIEDEHDGLWFAFDRRREGALLPGCPYRPLAGQRLIGTAQVDRFGGWWGVTRESDPPSELGTLTLVRWEAIAAPVSGPIVNDLALRLGSVVPRGGGKVPEFSNVSFAFAEDARGAEPIDPASIDPASIEAVSVAPRSPELLVDPASTALDPLRLSRLVPSPDRLCVSADGGAIWGIDAVRRRIDWVVTYPRRSTNPTRRFVDDSHRWREGALRIFGRLLVALPADSDRLLMIDVDSGELLASLSLGEISRVHAIREGQLIVSGDRIVWIDLEAAAVIGSYPGESQPALRPTRDDGVRLQGAPEVADDRIVACFDDQLLLIDASLKPIRTRIGSIEFSPIVVDQLPLAAFGVRGGTVRVGERGIRIVRDDRIDSFEPPAEETDSPPRQVGGGN